MEDYFTLSSESILGFVLGIDLGINLEDDVGVIRPPNLHRDKKEGPQWNTHVTLRQEHVGKSFQERCAHSCLTMASMVRSLFRYGNTCTPEGPSHFD